MSVTSATGLCDMRRAGRGTVEREAVARLVERVTAAHGIETRLDIHDGPLDALTPSDLVVSFDAPSRVVDWVHRSRSLARLARKILIVIVSNPERLGSPRKG